MATSLLGSTAFRKPTPEQPASAMAAPNPAAPNFAAMRAKGRERGFAAFPAALPLDAAALKSLSDELGSIYVTACEADAPASDIPLRS